jgi:putative membrane-bound dehydrogenase-like protein
MRRVYALLPLLLSCLLAAMAAGAAPEAEPALENSERAGEPMPPGEALSAIEARLSPRIDLFATEPVIRNPVAACVDAAGRLLVAENLTYAEKPLKTDPRFRDRVTMLEDADGDGTAERQATLVDGLEGLASVAVGRGGLWLLCPPRLLFIPDGHRPPPGWPATPDSDEPARRLAAAVPILDGFTVSPNSHHTFANGLAWGPDGWLYGRCGASSPGEIGAPGSAPAERVPLRGGIWRYHPERKIFEAICHGTTNPWGLDWDDLGNGFFTNTVNGHLWRVLPGAHYARSHTVEPHPWIVEPLGPHADHDHFDSGRHWTESRDGRADAHGGGHAHTGCVIVPEEPGWPEALRGRLLTLNLHGRRINVDRLDAEPTGIVGRHEADLARFGDPFFRGTDLLELPGQALAILDWSDTGECHEGTGVHRTSGRIYRFAFDAGDAPDPPVAPGTDLEALPVTELVRLLVADRWHARMATHLLADRHATGNAQGELDQIVPGLEDLVARGDTPTLRLRALWALWGIGRVDEPWLWALLDDPEPALRCWALRLLADAWPIDTVRGERPAAESRVRGFTLDALERLAIAETDPEVRLALACVLSRLPPTKRARLAAALVSATERPPEEPAATGPDFGPPETNPRAVGSDHHDLGAMLWAGLLPSIPLDREGIVDVWKAACVPGAAASHWPGLRRAIARRLAAEDAGGALAALLAAVADGGIPDLDDCLAGLAAGWRGRRHVTAPDAWGDLRTAVAAVPLDDPRREAIADEAARLDALFGDRRGVDRLDATARDRGLPAERRAAALDALVDARAGAATAIARQSLAEPELAPAAIRALLVAGDAADAARLVEACGALDGPPRDAALAALASRAEWGTVLLDAIERGDLPRDLLGAFLTRQLGGLGDAAIRARVAALVGSGGAAGPERIDAWKDRLGPERLAAADPAAGRGVWQKQCAACHRMHGEGGSLGPDLTGSGRRDLDYLLTNIVTPSATVSPDYRMKQVVVADGRVLSGIVIRRTAETLLLRTQTGEETIPMEDVDEVIDGGVSLMPEGILERLDEAEVADLFRFLMEP